MATAKGSTCVPVAYILRIGTISGNTVIGICYQTNCNQ